MGTIADSLGIASCFVSVFIFIMTRTILKNIDGQRKEYDSERFQLQTDLAALRMNIWDDQLLNIKIKSNIRTYLYTYKQKYIVLSSIVCRWHLNRAIRISKKAKINEINREKLCISLDYIIARLNKKEVVTYD